MFISSLDADADGHEGSDLRVDACAAARCARRRRRALGGSGFRRHRGGYVRARHARCCNCRSTPTTPNGSTGSGPRCWPPGRPAPSRAATTRSSPSGTGWRSPRWPRPRVALDRPELLDAAARCATDAAGPAPRRRPAAPGQPRRASSATAPRSSRTTRRWRPGLLTLYQLTGERAWLTAATGLLDTALAHFADPEQPGRWFDTADDAEQLMVRPGRSRWTARHRRVPRRSPRRCSPPRTSCRATTAERYARPADAGVVAATRRCWRELPRSAGHWLAVAEAAVRGPLQIAVACDAVRLAAADARPAGWRPGARSSSAAR